MYTKTTLTVEQACNKQIRLECDEESTTLRTMFQTFCESIYKLLITYVPFQYMLDNTKLVSEPDPHMIIQCIHCRLPLFFKPIRITTTIFIMRCRNTDMVWYILVFMGVTYLQASRHFLGERANPQNVLQIILDCKKFETEKWSL